MGDDIRPYTNSLVEAKFIDIQNRMNNHLQQFTLRMQEQMKALFFDL